MNRNEIQDKIATLGSKLLPKGSHLFLYGSRARGDNREDSDWDLLVLLNKEHQNSDFDT
ncbi:MAG: nucleotidyltransferase domain-containing protein, partial [Paludibacteraceae bacterium]|nr:nucleotidyltransferase domain-containing protein [Paludibacteraceae bacterium]